MEHGRIEEFGIGEESSSAGERVRAVFERWRTLIRPAGFLPVVDQPYALGEALKRRTLASLARPGIRIPEKVEVGVGEARRTVLKILEGALGFAEPE
jgi:hypothetical protein